MKVVGIIGGMSQKSTAKYYDLMSSQVNNTLGRHHSAKLIIFSVDFDDIVEAMHASKWDKVAEILIDAAKKLEKAGADIIIIACNSAHKVAQQVKESTNVSFVHILDPIGEAINASGITTVGLLGNRFTMEDGFYQAYLFKKFGVNTVIPPDNARIKLHKIIYDKLCHGEFGEKYKQEISDMILDLRNKGAEGVVLGCTELPLIFKQEDTSVKIFNSVLLHCKHVVKTIM